MRYHLIPAFLLLFVAPAMAGPREDTMAGLSRCASIADDRTYLNCIYGAVQPLRSQLRLPPAPADQIRLVPPGVTTAPQPVPRATMPAPQQRVASDAAFAGGMRERLENFSFDRRGLFNIMLGNGEMYRQEPGDLPRAKLLGRASDYVVYVIKDGTGAQMKITGDPNIYRMRRIN